MEEEFNHVVIAPGLLHGRKLPHIPGLSALEFLESSNTDYMLAKSAVEGKRTVVIGGASKPWMMPETANLFGTSSVTAVFVESLEEMRAASDEIRLAQDHHVVMMPERIVEHTIGDGMGLHVRHVNRVDNEDVLHADNAVIMAIGEAHDL